jgi:hypothetical protein
MAVRIEGDASALVADLDADFDLDAGVGGPVPPAEGDVVTLRAPDKPDRGATVQIVRSATLRPPPWGLVEGLAFHAVANLGPQYDRGDIAERLRAAADTLETWCRDASATGASAAPAPHTATQRAALQDVHNARASTEDTWNAAVATQLHLLQQWLCTLNVTSERVLVEAARAHDCVTELCAATKAAGAALPAEARARLQAFVEHREQMVREDLMHAMHARMRTSSPPRDGADVAKRAAEHKSEYREAIAAADVAFGDAATVSAIVDAENHHLTAVVRRGAQQLARQARSLRDEAPDAKKIDTPEHTQ